MSQDVGSWEAVLQLCRMRKGKRTERREVGSVWWVVFEVGETSGEVGERPWNDNLAKPDLEHTLEHLKALL